MTKAYTQREVNKNLFRAKLHLAGFSRLEDLGQNMNPPVSRYRVCQIIGRAAPETRLNEIASLLKTNIQTIFPKTN